MAVLGSWSWESWYVGMKFLKTSMWHRQAVLKLSRLSGSKVRSLGREGLARIACRCSDLGAMARWGYLIFVALLVLAEVPMILTTRRKHKQRPVTSEDGGDRGADRPGSAASTSVVGDATSVGATLHSEYRYCNDTVSATDASTAAGSRPPADAAAPSSGSAPMPGVSTVVELTWQTADARLTVQTDSPAMVEAAEWSAAVTRNPPPAQQGRALAAAQVADRVAGLLLVLEAESSPSIASAIEGILQPLVASYGDAVLCDLIEGIMQAMSRRGISEHRQRSMVAMLMFSLADPTTPLRMATASPDGHTLSTTLWSQPLYAFSGCIRSHMIGASLPVLSCRWLSSRWNRALCNGHLCQGSWYIHACFVSRCTQFAELAKYTHRQGMAGVCMALRGWFASRSSLHGDLRLRFSAGIQGLHRRVGTAQPRCVRQVSPPEIMSLYYHAGSDNHDLPTSCSLRQSKLVWMTRLCTLFPFLLPVECREMGAAPSNVEGRASSFSACHARSASFRATDVSTGSWSGDSGCARDPSLSGLNLWRPVDARASRTRSSSAIPRAYLSRLAQVSLGVAASFGLPANGANSSTCVLSLPLAGIGLCDVMLHWPQDASTPLIPLVLARCPSTLRLRLQLSWFDGQSATDLLHTQQNDSQDWSCQAPLRVARGSLSIDSVGQAAALLYGLFHQNVVQVWSLCETLTSGLLRTRRTPVMLTTYILHRSAGAWNSGCRCYRAYFIQATAPGPSDRELGFPGLRTLTPHCQVFAVGRSPACWTGSSLSRIVRIPAALPYAGRPLIQPWFAGCRCGSGRYHVPDLYRPEVSAVLCLTPVAVQHNWGSHFVFIPRECCAMGRGGHRGHRPHKSPASIARSKQRPGKRERRAQRDAVTAAGTAASSAPASSATATTATPIAASVPTDVASVLAPAPPVAPKAKAALPSTSPPSWLDPASPLAPPGSTFSLLTRPKHMAAPAVPLPHDNASAAHGSAPSSPRPLLPKVASTASSSSAVSAGSLPEHGPFLRPKSTAPSSSSLSTPAPLVEAAVEEGVAAEDCMAAPVDSVHAASPESTSSIDTEASCTLELQMEVIHDFWRDRTTQSEASPDTAIQALAAETIVEPPTLPPLYANAEGEGVPDMGADGVPAPWQRRQRRRMSLSSTSAGPVTPAATANDEAGTDAPPAEGSVSRLAYLRARLAANAARRRMTKRATFVRRALMPTNDVGQRWSSHRLHLIPTHLSQVAVHGAICLLSVWGLGLGALVGGSDCVAMDLSPAACRCVSFTSQGLRWASGQTSPRPGKGASIMDCMPFHCHYNDAFCHACTLNIGSSLSHSSTYALIFRSHVAMGTSKASKRRQANRPGRRERAADRGAGPAADIEEQFTEVSQASSTSQLVEATLGSPETSWPRSSGDVSGLTWTTESAAICRHATLVPPIPLQLRASTLGPLAHEPAAFSSTDMLSMYVPVPEGLSFDHLDTLGHPGCRGVVFCILLGGAY